ncbi:carbohydrate sulfotransferase 5-like [Mizuhopecten yessoensis]|uniref:Carbohydrate sulfotransferase 5 n=1 Tax=Mizuhopecten yessoensis TaxID=6573 RepID=A0A210Q0P4_MIZYE|nr:carbohydrate sulfotransferase 5-like [Mizuhopecten yessoensis]OWF42306.1 Carbohydrate sulfotransferase 5 [Mizuhopecten yessoensis]
MRSGSSFLGNVLQANPDVYYLFEPLHAIQFAVRSQETFYFLNGTSRKYDNFLDIAKLTIEGLTTCNMDIIPIKMWLNGFLTFSKKAKGMRFCVSKARTLAERHACVNETKMACLNSSHSALKIIRIPMDLLEPLMTSIPKLRILHLIRDPRATIMSQRALGVIPAAHFRQYVTRFCNRVYQDVVTAERFQTSFPGRTLRIFYEEIAKDPKSYTNIVYNFTDMAYTTKIESEIHSMTSEDVPKNCGQLCARKSNSTAQAEAWRKDVPMDLVATVDEVCQPLYSKLGYINVDSERMLRDITVPLRSTVTTFDDFRYA